MTTRPLTPPAAPFVTKAPGRPPAGMIKAEAALLDAWLASRWNQFDSVTYNVRVGRGIDPGPDVPDTARKAAIANSQRRIDALLMYNDIPTIVEVKVRGSLWAIGQLYGYRALWLRDNPKGLIPNLVMVYGTIDPDTLYACMVLSVNAYGPPF